MHEIIVIITQQFLRKSLMEKFEEVQTVEYFMGNIQENKTFIRKLVSKETKNLLADFGLRSMSKNGYMCRLWVVPALDVEDTLPLYYLKEHDHHVIWNGPVEERPHPHEAYNGIALCVSHDADELRTRFLDEIEGAELVK